MSAFKKKHMPSFALDVFGFGSVFRHGPEIPPRQGRQGTDHSPREDSSWTMKFRPSPGLNESGKDDPMAMSIDMKMQICK